MVFKCKYCSANFANRANQSRHEHRYDRDEAELSVFTCCICTFTCRKISELEKHMRTCHQKFTNCCRSCYMGFTDTTLFAQHMVSLHSLPVFGDPFQPTPANTDLAEIMLRYKPQIESLIEQKLSQGSKSNLMHLQLQKTESKRRSGS